MLRQLFRLGIGLAIAFVVLGDSTAGQTIIPDPRPIPPMPRPHPRPRPPRPWPPPPPPQRDVGLQVKKHTITVSIVDGVSVTDIDQVFFNPYPYPVEGTYIFPLADDVALSKFSMFINGQEVEGKLLSVEEARRTYESIVARMRDPALLEYLGTRMFKARIFPINPKSEARVRLSYTQMLDADDGLVPYRYPFAMGRHSGKPIESLSFVVNIQSTAAIKSVFSPSHSLAISRVSDHKASASYEGQSVRPDKDLILYYALSDKEFGMTVLTHRQGDHDGFFLVRISPPAKADAQDVLAKDISFVIDTSGSMAGEKMDQARKALRFCLANLNKEDRFNIIPFSHEALRFRDGLVPASAENVQQAREFAEGLKATGGTNINDALLAALEAAPDADADRPYLIVFLTDGQPTIGITEPKEILSNVAARNANRVRLFVFGVGHDVNTILLDSLAEENRGARDYVEPNEDLELKLSSFYGKVSNPVLADLSLSFGDLSVYDMYPPKLGDLFSGSELVVVGRYKGDGAKAVELTGKRRGKSERFVYETTFPALRTEHEFLPRLWAIRKVGFLLDEMRLKGENQELKDTVVQLATTYGIVTPYTAYLVTEPGSIAVRPGGRFNVLADAVGEAQRGGTWSGADGRVFRRVAVSPSGTHGGRASGKGAVAASRSVGALRVAEAGDDSTFDVVASLDARAAPTGEGGAVYRHRVVERVGTRTFYWVTDRWVDAAYDKAMETKKIELFSEAYFELARKHAGLAKCFALGERVVVVVDGVAYETLPPAVEE